MTFPGLKICTSVQVTEIKSYKCVSEELQMREGSLFPHLINYMTDMIASQCREEVLQARKTTNNWRSFMWCVTDHKVPFKTKSYYVP